MAGRLFMEKSENSAVVENGAYLRRAQNAVSGLNKAIKRPGVMPQRVFSRVFTQRIDQQVNVAVGKCPGARVEGKSVPNINA
ncbi:Uncharacterised protein [Pseudomonas taetrolens]|nr:Uncharacterised protein [Pseudomonas taetrolens]